jgi:hypothetical protein
MECSRPAVRLRRAALHGAGDCSRLPDDDHTPGCRDFDWSGEGGQAAGLSGRRHAALEQAKLEHIPGNGGRTPLAGLAAVPPRSDTIAVQVRPQACGSITLRSEAVEQMAQRIVSRFSAVDRSKHSGERSGSIDPVRLTATLTDSVATVRHQSPSGRRCTIVAAA